MGKRKHLILNLALAMISSLLLNGDFGDENSSGVYQGDREITAIWQVGTINTQSIVQSRTSVNGLKAHKILQQGNRAVVKVEIDPISARPAAGVGNSLLG